MIFRSALLLFALLATRAGWAQHCPAPDPPTRAPLARTSAVRVSDALPLPPTAWQPRFDAIGWPEWWSLNGLPTTFTQMDAGGLRFRSPLSGMARLDLLPVAWMDTLVVDGHRIFAPYRTLDAPRPLTEARYQSSGQIGLQSVEALHAQSRRRTFRGAPFLVHAHVGYTGRAADHEYDNSRLNRGRTTFGRVRAERQDGTSVTTTLHHARTAMGVSGGVLTPDPANANSIYDRFQAGVRLATPLRRTRRTDFGLAYASPSRRLALQYTADALSYERDPRDTVRTFAEVHQWHLSGHVPVQVGAWFPIVRGEFQTSPRSARLETVLHGRSGAITPGVFFRGRAWPTLEATWAHRRIRASAHLDAGPTSVFIVRGYGRWLQGTPNAKVQRSQTVRTEADLLRTPSLHLALHLVWSHVLESHELRLLSQDSARVERMAGTRGMAGLDAGWRRYAHEGLFSTATLSLQHARSDVAGWAGTHPALYGTIGAGWRTALFQDDLRLEARAELRGWSAHAGYALHGATGMPALPRAASSKANASGTLDLHLVGHIRTATLFLSGHNLLSNTTLLPGQQLVQGYPLPAGAIRFGIYWPILD